MEPTKYFFNYLHYRRLFCYCNEGEQDGDNGFLVLFLFVSSITNAQKVRFISLELKIYKELTS